MIAVKNNLLAASSALGLLASVALSAPALAQEAATPISAPAEAKPPTEDRNIIIVIGGRTIIAALAQFAVETNYDEDAVGAYGASTVGEVLDEIRRENGDEDPAFLVNGRPVSSPEDIAALPAEAVSRIEVLPRGSATKVGGQPGQRAYNVVLRPSVRSATLSASHEEATEGGWDNNRGEAIFTWVKGQDRANLSIRAARSSGLLEAERDFVPRTETVPYSPLGNVLPAFGTEIDPALSLLVGQPVSVLALPTGATLPTLASLVPGANRINPSQQSQHRTLRGPSRPIDINLTANKELNDWLSLSLSGRLGWTRNESVTGLPSARFIIPPSNPFTPFSTTTALALNDPQRPLQNLSEGNTQALAATLNAQKGPWHAALTAKWDRRANSYLYEFTGSLGSTATLAPTVNPFAGGLAATIPVSQRVSTSSFSTSQIQFEIQGPIVPLWAGPLSTRATLGASWIDYQADDSSGPRALERTELSARAGITVPLTSSQFDFLPQLGESELEFDYGAADLGSFGTLTRRSLGFNWQPAPWLRIAALDSREERAVAPELLAAPMVITPNVPYFDPLVGETVEVTTIYGGAANLADEDYRARSIALTISPLKAYGVQLNAEYAINDTRNQVGALPPASSAVVAAFPDRFVRDGFGTLTLVDSRSINFARQRSEVVRLGARFVIPLTAAGPMTRGPRGSRKRTPPVRLAFTLNQSILLDGKAVIRSGLPEVDLLAGGAIGIGGGQQRHNTRASIALTQGATGLRAEYNRRGASQLTVGTLAAPDLLRFAPLATIDLRAFAELGDIFPKVGLPRGTRLSMVIDNLANRRQRITDNAGITPQAYQPVRRDPLGRTVMFELRLAF